MVATLIKHEVLRTWRWIALAAGAALLLTSMSALAAALLPGPLNGLFGVLGIIFASVFPMALLLMIGIDYYRSTFSKTGYFTAAIPARGSTIYWVKFGYGSVVALLGLALTLGLAVIASIGFAHLNGGTAADVFETIDAMWAALASIPAWLQALILVAILLYPSATLAQYFFAATVGSEASFNRLGLGGPILVWFLYYVAGQVVAVIGLFLPPTLDLTDPTAPLLTYDPMAMFRDNQSGNAFLPLTALASVFLLAIVAMFWAKVSYDKRLELR